MEITKKTFDTYEPIIDKLEKKHFIKETWRIIKGVYEEVLIYSPLRKIIKQTLVEDYKRELNKRFK